MQQRREEILAKKAKLEELKRQRLLRKEQNQARQSIGSPSPSEVRHLQEAPKQTSTATDSSTTGPTTDAAAHR